MVRPITPPPMIPTSADLFASLSSLERMVLPVSCQFPLEHLFCLINCKSWEEEVNVSCLLPTAYCLLSYGASYHTDSWRRHRPRNHFGGNSLHQSRRCSDRVGRTRRRPGGVG